jgi:hypothetical protein
MVQRIGRGKAEAVFHAGVTGGFRGQGSPNDPDLQVAILPLEDLDGRRYCVEDFHVLAMTLFLTEADDGVTSVGEAKKLFAPTVMSFDLNGEPLETTRLPVKPFLKLAPAKAFILVQGRVVAPGEPPAGSHTLTVTIENDPVDPEVQVKTTRFFIDAAGTGACT